MNQIDTNSDGTLDEKEVQDEIQKDMGKVDEISMMQQMHDEKAGLAEFIKTLDTDKDGELSVAEMFGTGIDPKTLLSKTVGLTETKKNEAEANAELLKAAFEAADENQDKKLDLVVTQFSRSTHS